MSHAATWRAFGANEITHSAAHYVLAIASLTALSARLSSPSTSS